MNVLKKPQVPPSDRFGGGEGRPALPIVEWKPEAELPDEDKALLARYWFGLMP